MLTVTDLVQPVAKGRGGFASSGPKQGTRRKVILSDGSVIRWWKGVWKFQSTRWNRAVATSLSRYALTAADINGREVTDTEAYSDYDAFAKRLIPILGIYEFHKVMAFMKGA